MDQTINLADVPLEALTAEIARRKGKKTGKRRKKTRGRHGDGSLRQRGQRSWELKYYVPGDSKPHRETVYVSTEQEARTILNERTSDIRAKKLGPKVSLNDLFELYIADHKRKERAETYNVIKKIDAYLRPRLGDMDVYKLCDTHIQRYIDSRLKDGRKNATINRELSIITRALTLARKKKIANVQLEIEKLPERNTRTGFFEHADYVLFREAVPEHQKMLVVFAYHVGMRKGELLKLLWQWVFMDDEKPIIKIPGKFCKNGKPRTIPIYGEMLPWLQMAWQARTPECPYIFQWRGKRIKDSRKGWETARRKLNRPESLFHDFRRSAVRNMEREGISRTEARQITGHKTEAVYLRYDIASERGAIEVGERMAEFHNRQARRAAGGFSADTTQKQLGAELGAILEGPEISSRPN